MNKFAKILAVVVVTIFYVLHYFAVEKFIYKSLFFYFFLVLIPCILLLYVAFKLLATKNNHIKLPVNILSIIPFLFLFFPLIFKFVTGSVEWYSSAHFISVFALILILSFSLSNNYIQKNVIEKTIILFAVAESAICILQYFGIYQQSTFFVVTGSSANPNVTAMFLVLAFPLLIKQFVEAKKIKKILIALIAVVVLAVIIVLKSRAAYIGFVVVTSVLSVYYIKNRLNKILVLLIAVGILAAIFMSIRFFNFKEDSADGRLFVWKVSVQMITEQPFGYGYGMIQGEYNAAQARYFAENQTTETEQRNATYMHNVMNDYLEMFIQGGIVGGTLYLLFVSLLIYYGIKRIRKNLFYTAGILAFAVMALFNFVFYAGFAAMVFAYYVAVINRNTFKPRTVKVSKAVSIVPLILSIAAISFFALQISSQIKLKDIHSRLRANDLENIQYDFSRIRHGVSTSELYHRTGGNIALLQNDYQTAINFYNKAIRYAPFPSLLMRRAYCEMRLENYEQAKSDLRFASNIQPSLFEPYFNLMSIYFRNADIEAAQQIATQILDKEVKIPSERVDFYREQAERVLMINRQ